MKSLFSSCVTPCRNFASCEKCLSTLDLGLSCFQESGKVLKLRRLLYGLHQSPMLWFKHLKSKLENVGFQQASEINPCLFISDRVICLVYVDDTLLYARDKADIDEVLHKLVDIEGMALEVKDSVAGFLGVDIKPVEKTGAVILTQKGLIDKIISALKCNNMPALFMPAKCVLGSDKDGDPMQGNFNYASVIG